MEYGLPPVKTVFWLKILPSPVLKATQSNSTTPNLFLLAYHCAVARLVLSLFQSTLLLHCHGAMSHSSHATKPAQIIEGEYLDPQKLMRLLNQKYGPSEGDNFRVELRLNRYQIYPPQGVTDTGVLTEAQIKACRAYSRQRC